MDKVPPDIERPLWLQLKKVSKKYMDALTARLGHLGISRHYFLLVAIGEGKGEMTQQDLADLLETDKVAMVGILDHLGKKGFIKRTANRTDRRKHIITLTPKGAKALPLIKTEIAELNKKALTGLPANLAVHFPKALQRMTYSLEQVIEDAKSAPPG
jgi:DNA-binding MarR family transcriptional regulator